MLMSETPSIEIFFMIMTSLQQYSVESMHLTVLPILEQEAGPGLPVG